MTLSHRRLPVFSLFAAALLAAVVVATPMAGRLWRAHILLRALADRAAPDKARGTEVKRPLSVADVAIASAAGPIRGRIYRPTPNERGSGIVVVHGIHFRGIDERRLVAFARALAESGIVVLTPELEGLADYRITRRSEEEIAESVRYFAARSDLLSDHQVGLLGFSFAGGLSLVAAERPDVGAQLAWVTSVGGYHDLARVLRFLLENRIDTPQGVLHRPAHEYGVAVVLYENVDRLVPESDREVMRDALRAWLREDRARAYALAARRTTAQGERLFLLLESHEIGQLHAALAGVLHDRAEELDELSPRGKLARIPCPVYLLHGEGDSVIPASETQWADIELGRREHAALVSPLLEHVEVDNPAGLVDQLSLLRFVAALL